MLRLTNFETSNGPDVRVYLVAAPDVNENETVKQAGFIDLGAMKGNIGDQNYDVPADVDLAKYRSVSIWCRRFRVNFGTAPPAARPCNRTELLEVHLPVRAAIRLAAVRSTASPRWDGASPHPHPFDGRPPGTELRPAD